MPKHYDKHNDAVLDAAQIIIAKHWRGYAYRLHTADYISIEELKEADEIPLWSTDPIKTLDTIKVASLNIQGSINTPVKKQRLSEIWHRHDLDILVLQEARATKGQAKALRFSHLSYTEEILPDSEPI
jgi:hypothetical protein